jgi:DNA-binding winged helix-turn-helix (wHTH) protein/TolB-like protein/lipoprotein NlpI
MNYKFGSFAVDTTNFTLHDGETLVSVEPKVFDLIVYLIKNRHRLVSRKEIFDTIWAGREMSDTSLSNHIKSARKVLGDDGVKQRIIKTTHGRGYQFIAPTEKLSQTSQHHWLPAKIYPRHYWFIITCTAILVLFTILFIQYIVDKPQNNKIPKIAVLPLINSIQNTNFDYLGFVIADQIIGDLSYLKNITVSPSNSIQKYSNKNHDALSVGMDLSVDYVLSGNYYQQGDKIRVNLELVDIKTNQLLWRLNQFEVDFGHAFKLQDMVVKKVVEGLRIEFSEQEFNLINKDVSANSLSYEYYFRAISYPFTIEGNSLAVEMLKKSIDIDDGFAPAYVQLGNRIRKLEQYGLVEINNTTSAENYYLKALSLNPELISALSHLSFVYTENNKIDKAVVLARKMQKINPNSATAHFTLGYIYRYAGMVEQAIKEMEAAVSIDSKNQRFRSLIASYSATNEYQKALDMIHFYPESPFTLGWRGLISLHLGHKDQALAYFDQVINSDPQGLWRQVAIVHKAYINNDIEQGLLAASILEQTKVSDGETIYYNAAYYGLLNDKERCLNLLSKAIDNGYFNFIYIENSVYFDSVRNEDKYISIIADAKRKHSAFKNAFF